MEGSHFLTGSSVPQAVKGHFCSALPPAASGVHPPTRCQTRESWSPTPGMDCPDPSHPTRKIRSSAAPNQKGGVLTGTKASHPEYQTPRILLEVGGEQGVIKYKKAELS